MKLIVGLGNPGEKYQNTRHNVGFMVVDELARKLLPLGKTKWQFDSKLNSQLLIINSKLLLAKPQTMMNAAGFAVAKLTSRYREATSSVYSLDASRCLWVVHDDLDLPLGKIKIVVGHGSAGHHGIDSIVEQLGTAEFVRFRVGIGHPRKATQENIRRDEVIDYVLEDFSGKERTEAKKAIKKTARAIEMALEKGLEAAMNRYNS